MNLLGPPITVAEVVGLLASTLPILSLMLAIMMVSQLMNCLMKEAIVTIRKGKSIMQVLYLLVNLSKLPLKVILVLME